MGHVSLIATSKRVEHIFESTDSGTDTASDLFEEEVSPKGEADVKLAISTQHLEENGVDAEPPSSGKEKKSIEALLGSLYQESLQQNDNSDQMSQNVREDMYVEMVKEVIS